MTRRFLALIALVVVSSAAHAQLRWRLIGPFRGGRVLAVSGVPGEPEHFYFGSVNGGVWETIDAGRTWSPIFDSQPIGSIGALAVAPSDPKVIYVGSGEADMRSDIAQGAGMYKSIDGGKSWTKIGLADSQQIGRVLVHPENPDVVYVAALGHPYAANAERGVFRSTDGGKSWSKVLGPNADTGAIDLAFEPGNPKVIYASLWQTRRTPWSVYPPSNGAGSGVYKSIDGGETWKPISGLLSKMGRVGIAVAPNNPQRVYLIVDAEGAGGLYRSDDAGATWTRASSDARIWGRGWYFGGVTVEPQNADVVYVCNTAMYRSDDGGKTFIPVKGAPGGDDYHQLWIDPRNPQRRMLGVDQGALVSVDGGKTWSSWYNQPTGQFYHVITDNQFPYWVYGAQQDSGAASIPSRTNTIDGITIAQFRETTAGGESDNIAPDPKDPDVIFGGRVERLDLRTRQTRDVDPTLAYPGADNRHTWTLPLVFSPRDPRVLYYANQRVFRTDDGGNHWSAISNDLTREDPGAPSNLDALTAADKDHPGTRQGVVYAIAPSRKADHDIWAGTDDGLIWRTHDEGAHWDNVTPSALTPWSKVGIIEASHFNADVAYAAVDRHRLDDVKPYIYRTRDGGKHWQLITSGIPDGSFVNVVREDGVKEGLLYAGTEKGMYVSSDDGEHWQSLQMNLPITSVRDIDVHGNDLVIATHGRAFWVLDDVTPLRQRADAMPFFFAPSTAVRERGAGFTGTPMPKDEALAANPPFGANIDYVLGIAAQSITLEIFDDHDTLVRRFSSGDVAPGPNLARLTIAPEWVSAPQQLTTTPGMHRFTWSLRYPPAQGIRARGFGGGGSEGIWAPPGKYRLVLTIDGKAMTRSLDVVPDPNVKLPMSAYAEQFALARAVEQKRVAVSKQIADAEAAKTPVAPELTKLSEDLAKLAGAIDSADGTPTADMKKSWELLR